MHKILNVYMNYQFVGQLSQDHNDRLKFKYDDGWLQDKNAMPISCSLPLREHEFTSNECRGFFAGILPENNQRRLIAKKFGISADNDFALLEKIGGECPGAITFLPVDSSPQRKAKKSDYHLLSEEELANELASLAYKPLAAGTKNLRLSLAGAQEKMGVAIINNQFFLAVNDAATSHIIKPSNPDYQDMAKNEAFCLQLANAVGIPACQATMKKIGRFECLIIERYDRIWVEDKIFTRLHQEDFCQALAVVSENKYEKEGGPSFARCFALLNRFSSVPAFDINSFLEAVIFNFVIGNNDAHGKNFSLIYMDKSIRFAPLYDLISTMVYPGLVQNMAMKIGGRNNRRYMALRHWEKFAAECNLPFQLVKMKLKFFANNIAYCAENYRIEKLKKASLSDEPIIEKIIDIIAENNRKIQAMLS